MMDNPGNAQPSPLDEVMTSFLGYVQSQSSGFVTGVQSRDAAAAVDVPEPLVDAIFVSARTRGLIGPDFNARGRTRWIVSRKGLAFLERQTSPISDSGETRDDN